MKYTDHYSPSLMEQYWLAKVSHHHYWFDNFQEILRFQNSRFFDVRMTIASPTK